MENESHTIDQKVKFSIKLPVSLPVRLGKKTLCSFIKCLQQNFQRILTRGRHNLITLYCSLNAGFANAKGFPHPFYLCCSQCGRKSPPIFLVQFQMRSVGRADLSCRCRHHGGSKECVSWRLAIIRPDKLQHVIKIQEITAIRQVKLSAKE